jgi:flagellar assembly factor FliW
MPALPAVESGMSVSANVDAAQIDLAQLGPESIITFPQGLVGQPHWKRFVLLTAEDDVSVGVLQSVDDEHLSLLVTNPKRVLADYTIVLGPDDSAVLGLEADQLPVVLTTLRIHDDLITTNLVGPLVINPRTREAKQVVLADSSYSTQHAVGRLTQEAPESCLS